VVSEESAFVLLRIPHKICHPERAQRVEGSAFLSLNQAQNAVILSERSESKACPEQSRRGPAFLSLYQAQKVVILSERSESKDLHFVQDGSTSVVSNLLQISDSPHQRFFAGNCAIQYLGQRAAAGFT
jgi:hypothetical protein